MKMKRRQCKKNSKAASGIEENNGVGDERRRRREHQQEELLSAKLDILNYNNMEEEEEEEEKIASEQVKNHDHHHHSEDNNSMKPPLQTIKKCVNLTRFVYQNKKYSPPSKTDTDSDFESPAKKIKRAPKLLSKPQPATGSSSSSSTAASLTTTKLRKKKRQQKITTAFMRNEQMFSEVAAQHSMAENFNPDEVQLALAISRSEVEKTISKEVIDVIGGGGGGGESCAENLTAGTTVISDHQCNNIRDKLKNYGFRTASKEDYKHCLAAAFLNGQRQRTKTKWASKFTALTLRDPLVQTKKLNDYVESVLQRQRQRQRHLKFDENHSEPPCEPQFKLQSSVISDVAVVDPTRQVLRNLETLSTTTTTTEDAGLERFFITELFPVTKLEAGHLLKDWTTIPGRDDLSPERQKQKQKRRVIAQVQRYKKFYEKLESNFLDESSEEIGTEMDAADGDGDGARENRENTKALASAELDDLSKVIESSQQQDHEQEEEAVSNNKHECVEKPLKTTLPPSNEICLNIPSQTQRSTSPDLFAESDSDSDSGGKMIVENKSNNITTFETYSSDDVKISPEPVCMTNLLSAKAIDDDEIIDLTQDDKNEDDDDSESVRLAVASKKLDFLADSNSKKNCLSPELDRGPNTNKNALIEVLTTPPKSLHAPCMDRDLLKNSALIFGKSISFESNMDKRRSYISPPVGIDSTNQESRRMCSNQSSIASIDLTQSDQEEESIDGFNEKTPPDKYENNEGDDYEDKDDDDDDDDDDNMCILLSDDEVNYSIMAANNNDYCSSSLSEKSIADEEDEGEENPAIEAQHDFSILNLIEINSTFHRPENPLLLSGGTYHSNNTHALDLSGDIEPIDKQYLQDAAAAGAAAADSSSLSPAAPSTPIKELRAEFGILESQSECFSQSPAANWMMKTSPSKRTPQKVDMESPSLSLSSAELLQANFNRQSYSRRFQSFLFESAKSPSSSKKCQKVQANAISISSPPIQVDDDDDDDDFDEFDRLVYGNPPPKSSGYHGNPPQLCDMPRGLDKLLTAELSSEIQQSIRQEKEESPSPSKVLSMLTPEKAVKIFETEDEEEIRINNHVYTVRKTNSPKPNFAQLGDSELLKQLYNFGIKPLKRHQAVKILEYIYNETHPIVDSSRVQSDENPQNINADLEEKIIEENNNNNKLETNSSSSSKINNKFKFQDCNGNLLLHHPNHSQDISAELRNDELYIFQTNITKKTQYPLVPLHIAWFNLVKSSCELHESILMYEPIDLQEIYLFLKSLGYRYDPKDLKNFFDRRCIIFRYDLTPPEKQGNRNVRNPKKKFKSTSTSTTTTTTTTTSNRSQKIPNPNLKLKRPTKKKSQHTLHKYLSL